MDNNCRGILNHTILVVGYDLTGSIPYIIAKNSWGEKWGDRGYVKIALKNVTNNSKGICKMFEHNHNVISVLY